MISPKTVLVSLAVLFSTSASFAQSLHSAARAAQLPPATALSFYNNMYCQPACAPAEFAANIPGLSIQEADVLRRYTSGDYREINAALRQDKLTMSQVVFVKVLDMALEKLPVVRNITVYRGSSQNHDFRNFRAYTSTSVEQSVAEERFMNDQLMVIHIKSGYDISVVSQAGQEREILLPRNFQAQVQSITQQPREVINEETGERSTIMVQVVTLVQK